jgi:hypothetical protein
MLYFRTQPDPVFMVLLDQALRWELDTIRKISASDDLDAWLIEYPALERWFSPYSAVVTLEELVLANGQTTIYRPTEYHWLVLFEGLRNFCLWHNDRLLESRHAYRVMSGYRFGRLEFETIFDRYFWDQSFLAFPDLGLDHECASVYDEFMGEGGCDLASGLRPHPSKLRFTVVQDVAWHVPEPQESGQWRLP